MSVKYVAVQWNTHKRVYDLLIASCIVIYIVGFVVMSRLVWRDEHAIDPPVMIIRAFGTCAILLLHIVLCIGPLARLDRRFVPFLFNRRHLGVATFLVACIHGVLVVGYYHGFGTVNPFVSLGLGALLILFLMAATSHDFWLKNLSPRVWKGLHMGVYLAYALVIMHVALGALRSETNRAYAVLLLVGVVIVSTLHIIAGLKQKGRDARDRRVEAEWVDVCAVSEIPDSRAKGVRIKNEPVAVFKYDGKVSAVAGACVHQGGPLAEGRILGGCITCPWHGYQYRPGDGCSPPPFTEKLHTYQIRIRKDRVEMRAEKLPPGTAVEPAALHQQEPAHV
jgi:nitrite reductase/ring-hydroxylating ferredoxin subunit